MITAPYNFVPLNEKIFYPPWTSEDILKNIHDVPFKDGESGVIDVEITAKSPIFIKDSKNHTEFCHFTNENGDKEYHIPATSIKGMIRNVLEIMSFSAMSFIDDKKYSMRDLSGKSGYKEKIITGIKCGWLYKEKDGLKVRECDGIHRIKYQEIGYKFKIDDYRSNFLKGKFNDTNDPLKNACAKYELVKFENVDKIYNFSKTENKNNRVIVKFDDNGPLRGKVVLTGHPSARVDNKEKPSGKNYDFVFVEKDDAKIFNVSKDVFEVFKFAYFDGRVTQPMESTDWAFWKEKLKNGKEVPVFFHTNDSEVTNFGLSYLYKFPFSKSVKEVLEHTQVRENRPDLAELIFGFSKKTNDKQKSLKGRVFISHAKAINNIKIRQQTKLVLGSPKASYYPIYLKQDKNIEKYITYDDKDAKLSGFKRYAVHKDIAKSNTNDKTANVETTIIPLEAGAKFKFKIVVHNMLPIEIGALLSAITFHQNNLCYHSIGMAKPLGYGKIKLSILDLKGFDKDIKEYLRDFESAINSAIFNGKTKWHESEQIKNLFSMASEQNNTGDSELKYMELEDFAKSKTKNYNLEKYIQLTNINTIQATPLSDQQSISCYKEFIDDLKLKEKAIKEKVELEKKEREIKEKERKLQDATKNMSEFDKRFYLLKNDPNYKNMPEITALFKAISETDIFNDIKFEALCKLQKLFKDSGKWKEETKQKKPEKDRDYKDTLKIIAMFKEFEK